VHTWDSIEWCDLVDLYQSYSIEHQRRGASLRVCVKVVDIHCIWVSGLLLSITWEGDCSLGLVGIWGWCILEVQKGSHFLLWICFWHRHILGDRGSVFLWGCNLRFIVGRGMEGFV